VSTEKLKPSTFSIHMPSISFNTTAHQLNKDKQTSRVLYIISLSLAEVWRASRDISVRTIIHSLVLIKASLRFINTVWEWCASYHMKTKCWITALKPECPKSQSVQEWPLLLDTVTVDIMRVPMCTRGNRWYSDIMQQRLDINVSIWERYKSITIFTLSFQWPWP